MPVPDFITALRSRVGHDLLWLPGVTGVVLDDAGRVLLGRRTDTGLWALVSGILEPGEEPAVGLEREIAEETGVRARAVALTYVSTGSPVHYPNGDEAQYLDLTFLCRHVRGEARVCDDESSAVAWFAPDDLPDDLSASSRDRLAHTQAWRDEPARGTRFRR